MSNVNGTFYQGLCVCQAPYMCQVRPSPTIESGNPGAASKQSADSGQTPGIRRFKRLHK
ncbi:hypothetical protein DESC_610377 [Desulfosarcina cetonica]|nr:hypothetical protein DESC_610377 [Desulfosarcina cetonica]